MADTPPALNFQEWLAAQKEAHSSLPAAENVPSNSTTEAIWSVPIISYGNDTFGWEQKEDGTHLSLQHDETTNTFRITTGEGKTSMLGNEEQGLQLVGAVTPIDESHPLVRLIFVIDDAKTDFRNVKLPSAAHAKKLVKHLVHMHSIPVVQRPRSDMVLYQGLKAILEDMAKEWEKPMPGSMPSSTVPSTVPSVEKLDMLYASPEDQQRRV
ncbi:MAG: hypothetical protein Q9218_005188 [Villophora microphyllina]